MPSENQVIKIAPMECGSYFSFACSNLTWEYLIKL